MEGPGSVLEFKQGRKRVPRVATPQRFNLASPREENMITAREYAAEGQKVSPRQEKGGVNRQKTMRRRSVLPRESNQSSGEEEDKDDSSMKPAEKTARQNDSSGSSQWEEEDVDSQVKTHPRIGWAQASKQGNTTMQELREMMRQLMTQIVSNKDGGTSAVITMPRSEGGSVRSLAYKAKEKGDDENRGESEWHNHLSGKALKQMAKSMGKVVAAPDYYGEANPTLLSAWKDSIISMMRMYEIPEGPAQVQAASWFLKGRAQEWWAGAKAAKTYLEMTSLDVFFELLQLQFQPLDAAEQCIDKWCSVRQTHSITAYMDEVDRLHHTWGLCEKAEFGLAMRGLKPELKGVIRRSLAEQRRVSLTLRELRVLAKSAEIKRFEPRAHRERMLIPPMPRKQSFRTTTLRERGKPALLALTIGAVELRNKQRDERKEKKTGGYACGVCRQRNHLTAMCGQRKKEGCWRCGGKHLLWDCRVRIIRQPTDTLKAMPPRQDETARAAVLAMITNPDDEKQEVINLTYPVRVGVSNIVALATLDIGAQCSVICSDVAIAAGIIWTEEKGMADLRGVSGEPVCVRGSAKIRLQGNGITTTLNAWVVDGVRPQIVLGMPWIVQERPQVDWSDCGSLVFPSGRRWKISDESNREMLRNTDHALMMERSGLFVDLMAVAKTTEANESGEERLSAPEWMEKVLCTYDDLFKLLSGEPPDNRVKHAIHLVPNASPVMKRPYRLSAAQRKDAEDQIRHGIKEGWLQPSRSAWGTAILMVPKKDGTWRMCVDYRDLNALTIADAYPLPRIDDLLHRLGNAHFFTRLDLQSGYYQLWIEPDDREKTAFRVAEPVDGCCHFEWKVMPFGLKNAPPTFQRYMTQVMSECAEYCLVYMDDLLVYSLT